MRVPCYTEALLFGNMEALNDLSAVVGLSSIQDTGAVVQTARKMIETGSEGEKMAWMKGIGGWM